MYGNKPHKTERLLLHESFEYRYGIRMLIHPPGHFTFNPTAFIIDAVVAQALHSVSNLKTLCMVFVEKQVKVLLDPSASVVYANIEFTKLSCNFLRPLIALQTSNAVTPVFSPSVCMDLPI